MNDNEPTTQAGRALLSRIHALGMSRYGHITFQDGWSDVDADRDILAIEAEAAAALVERSSPAALDVLRRLLNAIDNATRQMQTAESDGRFAGVGMWLGDLEPEYGEGRALLASEPAAAEPPAPTGDNDADTRALIEAWGEPEVQAEGMSVKQWEQHVADLRERAASSSERSESAQPSPEAD